MIVKCAPDQATWPVNPATCTSFAPAGVRLDRSITQSSQRPPRVGDRLVDEHGRQGAQDQRRLRERLDAPVPRSSSRGSRSQFTLYSTNYQVPPSPTSPFTYYAKYASASDGNTRHDRRRGDRAARAPGHRVQEQHVALGAGGSHRAVERRADDGLRLHLGRDGGRGRGGRCGHPADARPPVCRAACART